MVPGGDGLPGEGLEAQMSPIGPAGGALFVQRARERDWSESGATRSGNVRDDTATIAVRPITASHSQKSRGGFLGVLMKRGRPSHLPVPALEPRILSLQPRSPEHSSLAAGSDHRIRRGFSGALAPSWPRSVLDGEGENRPTDCLRQIGVQHHMQTAGAGLDCRYLKGRRAGPLRHSRAARAEQGVQLAAHLSKLEIEAGFVQCIHLSTAVRLEPSFRL